MTNSTEEYLEILTFRVKCYIINSYCKYKSCLEVRMYSAQDFINGRVEKQRKLDSQTNEEIYLKQKIQCTKKITCWFQHSIMQNYQNLFFDSPIHPNILKELNELGYITRLSKSLLPDYPYELVISLPHSSTETVNVNEKDENKVANENKGKNFLHKFLSSVRKFLTSNKNTL